MKNFTLIIYVKMTYITILELFPLYHSARKWGFASQKEIVRLEKEFTIVETSKETKEYTIDFQLFRKNGFSDIRYYENNQVKQESWYLNNKRHRKDGPAWINYYENGQIRGESWHLNGIEKMDLHGLIIMKMVK